MLNATLLLNSPRGSANHRTNQGIVRLKAYDMTLHAMEEIAEDDLDILDVEQALLTGQVVRREQNDPRGTKYVVEGIATDDETSVGIVGRFQGTERYLIITVYEGSKEQ